jgi:hypothetical protein
MFRASTDRLRTWFTRVDEALDDVLGDSRVDMLGDSRADVLGESPVPVHRHPHRFPLRWQHDRRGGSVPPRPAHCISPVHARGGTLPLDVASR